MCLRSSEQALCAWMEVNQFGGDFVTSANPAKHPQPDVLAWGGGAEAGGFRSVSLEHLQPLQRDPGGKQVRPGPSQSKGEARRDGTDYACTCPGCPFSTSPSSFELLRPRPPAPSPPRPAPEPEAGGPAQQQRDGPCRGSQVQGYPQLLGLQDGAADSAFSHTHHHFHHHHCPLTSCLPCPRFVPRLPCLCCCHGSLGACSRETDASPPPAERARPAGGGDASPLHPCMHCPASFPRPFQLLQHQRSEHAHKPPGFLCTECGRSFNSHSNLRIHLNVHTGARPYPCPDCGKSFSQSGALKIHRRIHTGERPYACEFCSRTFPHLSAVRTHERIHTGEKPYHCSQCGKRFTQSGSLKIHTHRVHRGERPFVCSVCGKRFSHQSGIGLHYRAAHGLLVQHVGEAGGVPQRPSDRVYADAPAGELPSQSGGGAPGSPARQPRPGRARPAYTCEDCGLQFRDAPSRNKHQILVHYISENSEDDDGRSKTAEKEISGECGE